MPRRPAVRWESGRDCWRSDVGPYLESGRGRAAVRFRHPNSREGKAAASADLEAYLAERDRLEGEATFRLDNPPVWQVVQAFLQWAEGEVRAKTFASYRERLGIWQRYAPGAALDAQTRVWCDHRPAATLRPGDLSGVAKAMKAEGKSPKTIAGVVASVKQC